jgi:predicted Zn-dependent protease
MNTANQSVKALAKSIRLANQTFKEGKTNLAFKHIEEGFHIDEHNVHLLEIAGTIHYQLNDNKKTIKYAQELITCHPLNPRRYIRQAQGLLKSKRPSEANQIALDRLKKAPKNQQILAIASESCQTLKH